MRCVWNRIFQSIIAIFVSITALDAVAKDKTPWEKQDPVISEWIQSLKQPDHPGFNCCGHGDMYYAATKTEDGKVYAIIDDDRDNAELRRIPVQNGTKILIPPEKYKADKGNPTGRSLVFLSVDGPYSEDYYYVICFVDGDRV